MTNAQSNPPVNPAPELQHLQHIPALDGLRGIAILLVLAHNAAHFGSHAHGVFWIAALIGSLGWVGVHLFFVLSGFLITSRLLAAQSAPNYFSAFFGRRILRIFPLYYLVLVVGLLILPAVGHPPARDPAEVHQIWLWTFLSNWAYPFGVPPYGFAHFWSLAVEEQFYLIWPFIVYRATQAGLTRTCYALIVVALMFRGALAFNGATELLIYELTFCRIDVLAMGALLAVWVRSPDWTRQLHEKAAARLIPAALAVFLLGAVFSRLYTRSELFTQTLGYTLLGICFGAMLLACLVGNNRLNQYWRRFLSVGMLRSIGKYSYAMYVFHFPIELYLEPSLPLFQHRFGAWSGVVFLLTVSLLTYGAAFLSYHLYEKHFLRLKSRFIPQVRTGPAQPELLRHA